MTINKAEPIDMFFEYVMKVGNLRTPEHARVWTDGILKTLGTALNGKTKRQLTKALPEELAPSLKEVFWLLHFRDPNLSSHEFLQRAARRSGNSDPTFAMVPTLAVFSGLKRFINADLDQHIERALAPEIRELWLEALPEHEKALP